MKKNNGWMALFIIAMFMISIVPATIADNDSATGDIDGDEMDDDNETELEDGDDISNQEDQDEMDDDDKSGPEGYSRYATGMNRQQKERIDSMFQKREAADKQVKEAYGRYLKAKEQYLKMEEKQVKSKLGFVEARNAMINCKKDSVDKKSCDKMDSELFEKARQHVIDSAERTITHLEKVKAMIESSEELSEDEYNLAIEEIDAAIAKLNDAIATAEAATTKDELKEAAKMVNSVWEEIQHKIKEHGASMMFGKVGSVVEKSNSLKAKLARIIDDMEKRNISTDAIQPRVDKFNELVDNATEKNEEAQLLIADIRETRKNNKNLTEAEKEQLESDVEKAKELMKSAYEDLKEANKALIEIIQFMKSKDIRIDDETTATTEEESTTTIVESTTTTVGGTTSTTVA